MDCVRFARYCGITDIFPLGGLHALFCDKVSDENVKPRGL